MYRKWQTAGCVLLATAAISACGGGEDAGADGGDGTDLSKLTEEELIALGPCREEAESPPEKCGAPCEMNVEGFSDGFCGDGFYCRTEGPQAGTCTAHCTPDDAETSCPEGAFCTSYGRCVNLSSGQEGAKDCPKQVVQGKRETVTIELIADQSGSMAVTLEGTVPQGGEESRWEVLQRVLGGDEDEDGILSEFEGLVRFGLTTFSSRTPDDPEPPAGSCHTLRPEQPVAPDFDNAETILAALEDVGGPKGGTPAGASLDQILDEIDSGTRSYDSNDPVFFLFILDGSPRWCDQEELISSQYPNLNNVTGLTGTNAGIARVFLSFNPGLAYTKEQLARARTQNGIETFVIGLGVGTPASQIRLDQINGAPLDALRVAGVFEEDSFGEYVTYENIPAEAQQDTDELYDYLLGETLDLEKTLDEIASAGCGDIASCSHYSAEQEGQFRAALEEIVESTVSCELRFGSEAEVPPSRVDEVCENMTVLFDSSDDGDEDSASLPCASNTNDDEGWVLSESRNKLVLVGESCEQYKRNPGRLKDISFACNFAILE